MKKTYISDIVDLAEMEREIAAGYINRRFHPEFPELATVGYSDSCQFDRHWSETCKALRGVIYDTRTGEVLARPFHKFFNHSDESQVEEFSPDTFIMGAWDKADGSLGIQYVRPDGKVAIATRGSFESDQAIHATELINSPRYNKFRLSHAENTGFTFLWEIVYPTNRIVLNYGERDELIFIGTIWNEDGAFLPPGPDPDVPVVQNMEAYTLGQVLEIPPRENAEGVVVWLDSLTAIKIKQADYVALHRIVSSLNLKEVWRQLSAGTFREFAEALPDEFHQWARDTSAVLMDQYRAVENQVLVAWDEVAWAYAEDNRRVFAEEAKKHGPLARYLFLMYDEKDIESAIWKTLEPRGANGELS